MTCFFCSIFWTTKVDVEIGRREGEAKSVQFWFIESGICINIPFLLQNWIQSIIQSTVHKKSKHDLQKIHRSDWFIQLLLLEEFFLECVTNSTKKRCTTTKQEHIHQNKRHHRLPCMKFLFRCSVVCNIDEYVHRSIHCVDLIQSRYDVIRVVHYQCRCQLQDPSWDCMWS